jgi:hypothetical protein
MTKPLAGTFFRRPVFLRVFIILFLAGIPILFPRDRAVVSFRLFSSPSSLFALDEQQFRVIVATAHAVESGRAMENWRARPRVGSRMKATSAAAIAASSCK